jgi:3-methyladenine DNA glycosylase AlkD
MITKSKLLDSVDKALVQAADSTNLGIRKKEWAQSKIRVPAVRKAGREVLKALRSEGLTDIDEVLILCNHLLSTKAWTHRVIAFQWSFSFKRHFRKNHFSILENWIKNYVTGWGSCDDLCVHSMGYFLMEFPVFVSNVKDWIESSNPYIRRASAVVFIYGLRRKKFIEFIFDVADRLMNDENIYVQKGYGWMLKEATKFYQDRVVDYVMRRKHRMPRVALRYAIEKMPETMRKKAMAH